MYAYAKSRQKRKDPIQENIVSKKDVLNERTSKLIEFIKDLKRGWNGFPAPLVGVQDKVKLTSPLPEQIIEAGEASARELSEILSGLREIKSLQDEYSAERAKKVLERKQNIQAISEQILLEKHASNVLTRMWSHIIAPFSSEEGKWERLKLLRALSRLDSNLLDIDEKILGDNKDVLEAFYLVKQLYLDSKSSFFESFQSSLNNMLAASKQEAALLEKSLKEKTGNIPATMRPQIIEQTTKPNEVPVVNNTTTTTEEPVVDRASSIEKGLVELNRVLHEGPVTVPLIKKPVEEKLPEMVSEKPSGQPEIPVSTEENKRAKILKQRDLILEFVGKLYKEAQSKRSDLHSTTKEPWNHKIIKQWNELNNALKNIRTAKNIKELVVLTLDYFKYISNIHSTLDQVLSFGQDENIQTIDELKLDQNAALMRHVLEKELKRILDISSDDIQKSASRFSTSFRRMMTYLSSDKAKHIKLHIDKYIKEARNGLQSMMDNLENRNIDFKSLIYQSELFYTSIIEVFDKMIDLAEMYNTMARVSKSQKTHMGDMIPISEISGLKSIRFKFQEDQKKIYTLKETEQLISVLSPQIEAMKNISGS